MLLFSEPPTNLTLTLNGPTKLLKPLFGACSRQKCIFDFFKAKNEEKLGMFFSFSRSKQYGSFWRKKICFPNFLYGKYITFEVQ